MLSTVTFFNATVYLVLLSTALQTTPYAPLPLCLIDRFTDSLEFGVVIEFGLSKRFIIDEHLKTLDIKYSNLNVNKQINL